MSCRGYLVAVADPIIFLREGGNFEIFTFCWGDVYMPDTIGKLIISTVRICNLLSNKWDGRESLIPIQVGPNFGICWMARNLLSTFPDSAVYFSRQCINLIPTKLQLPGHFWDKALGAISISLVSVYKIGALTGLLFQISALRICALYSKLTSSLNELRSDKKRKCLFSFFPLPKTIQSCVTYDSISIKCRKNYVQIKK